METACLTQTYTAEVQQIVTDVYTSMLKMDVERVNIPPQRNPGEVLTASVQFVGSWKGAFSIECTPEQTFEYTRRLLAVDDPTEINEDVCDAFGELANMIGGNLKAILPPVVQLSMPSVVRGQDYSLRMCKANTVCSLDFDSEYGFVRVTLVEFVAP